MSTRPQKFPLHVVCAWMGNSQAVAAKHYLQVTDEHFKIAAEGCAKIEMREIQPVAMELK